MQEQFSATHPWRLLESFQTILSIHSIPGDKKMIKITLQHRYCIIEPLGPLSKDDFLEIARQIDPIIESDGYLDGLIIKTREFPGWEGLGDVIDHFRFVKNHHQVIKKIALVTDAKIGELVPSIVGHFVKAEVKHFDYDDYDSAVGWVA